MTGIVVAESVTANAGLGFLVVSAEHRMDTLTVFAAIVMLCIIVAWMEHGVRRSFRGA